MKHSVDIPLISTIKERCRVCYTCVRECPVKAIRIAEGQAEVLHERCIGCGNCVRVCSQHAKEVLDGIPQVYRLLDGAGPVAAVLAPSFPAEFAEWPWPRLVAALRKLGFAKVAEVGFGADLVARRYARLMARDDRRHYIATTCPAIVAFVERYHPELVESLAPIVSPMVAEARALRRVYGKDLRIVFIGPCIAKKGEAASEMLPAEIDAVLTFGELREMFSRGKVEPDRLADSDFDPPHAGTGALFAISRGLLQAANLHEDLISGEVVAADGRTAFADAIKEFQDGDLDARLLEVLCCKGCIMGAGMTCQDALFSRRNRVRQYVRERIDSAQPEAAATVESFDDLDLSRRFEPNDQRIPVPFEEEVALIMAKMGKSRAEDELNCGACGYDTCREHAVAIFKGLAETEMCLPYSIEQLRRTVKELATSHEQLASAQEALMQSEKLASMGQLAAGIAHEVNNPLGVVLMYAHLLKDAVTADTQLKQDVGMIVEQADRCKKIVSGLLHFARQNKLVVQPTNLDELVDRSIRVLHPPTRVDVVIQHAMSQPVVELDADQIVQVLTNLVSNAYAAMSEGGTLTVRTEDDERSVRLIVRDTGVGIAQENVSKIFEPFYTTKQMGKGTGLGLAVTYGIVKMHCGDIRVQSNADPSLGPTGSTFTVSLPRQRNQE